MGIAYNLHSVCNVQYIIIILNSMKKATNCTLHIRVSSQSTIFTNDETNSLSVLLMQRVLFIPALDPIQKKRTKKIIDFHVFMECIVRQTVVFAPHYVLD